MDIEVEGTPEALDQGHCADLYDGFGVAGFVDQMRGNGAADNTQHLAHDGGFGRAVEEVLREARRVAVITSLDPENANLKHLPPTMPIIHKSASFGDDLAKTLQDEFLL